MPLREDCSPTKSLSQCLSISKLACVSGEDVVNVDVWKTTWI